MNIILIISILAINLFFLIVFWFRFLKPRQVNNQLQKKVSLYEFQVSDLESEVTRQSKIIENYKEKLQFTSKKSENRVTAYMPKGNIVDILNDKQALEKEKEAFKLKNKKLWEQSMAVYKEKERINRLRKYIETRHNDLTSSISYALHIQKALLPTDELLKKMFPEHFILYRPRDIVSGDFYWARKIKNRTIIIASDCTGHGVPGAFMSLLGISFLNEIAGTYTDFSASDILEAMRKKVKSAFEQNDGNIAISDGMDMVACIVDHKTRKLEFAGANNGIFIAKKNCTLIEIKGTNNPVSYFFKEKPFENHIIQLEANDSIFMYSDGYFDQFGGSRNRKLSRKRFASLLESFMDKNLPFSSYKKKLETFLDDWQGDENQIDDILVFGVTCFTY